MSPGSLETTHTSVTNATQASFAGCPANSDLAAQPLAAHRWKVLKHRIADVMTITVTDGFEPIDVDQGDTQAGAFVLVTPEMPIKHLEDIAPVRQACENLRPGHQGSGVVRLPK